VVRVRFMDGSVKTFGISSGVTAEEMLKLVAEKIELKEYSTFAIFEAKDEWERCLDADEKPAELKGGGKDKDALIFKKRIFLRDDMRESNDLVARQYIFLQALYNVIESVYPCSSDEVVRLAGYHVQIVYGDHNSSTHVSGFLQPNLAKFVPKNMISTKKPQEWETAIFKEHRKHIGQSADDAKLMYLNTVRKWDFYGTTFFPPCKLTSQVKKIKGKVVIGVNQDGLMLLKSKDQSVISKHPYTEICSWASSSSTFAFEFGTQNEATKFTFETKHGSIIASTIQTYIDILVDMLTNGEQEEDDSAVSGNSVASDGDSDV